MSAGVVLHNNFHSVGFVAYSCVVGKSSVKAVEERNPKHIGNLTVLFFGDFYIAEHIKNTLHVGD
jgi:hypothetical protein